MAEMLRSWLETHAKSTASYDSTRYMVERHLIPSSLGQQALVAVTPGAIEALLKSKAADLAPQTLNHLRGYLRSAFEAARRAGKYGGTNPLTEVRKRRVPRRVPDYLRRSEVPLIMDALDPAWRPLFATAIYTGMRKEELLGLRKVDVDFDAGLITIARSYDSDTTKGGHADVIPIAAELAPFLKAAVEASPSDLVFPAADGSMRARDASLQKVLRRALGRAGIVQGYRQKCRRKGCGHVEATPDRGLRTCPTCGMRLWPTPVVRPIRFHDLRHTTACS
jgi:integrase